MKPSDRWIRQVGTALVALGIDPRKLLHLGQVGRFLSDRRRFLKAGGRIDHLMPMLADYDDQAGEARGHYFHQDLLVARLIHQASPARHIDVGSRIDGFVAHVAAFRDIEIMDIRPLATVHSQIKVLRRDLMAKDPDLDQITDSVSCLHALEHFGLGRYGDRIDPDGHHKGFEALARMLKSGGMLYLSLPIGRERLYFNAHRVSEPGAVVSWAAERFEMVRFDFVDDAGDLHERQDLAAAEGLTYGCGIYSLRKLPCGT